MNGPVMLDATINRRPLRRDGMPNSNRSQFPAMAPHGIYPSDADDTWVAIACRDDDDWARLSATIAETWASNPDLAELEGRLAVEDDLDDRIVR